MSEEDNNLEETKAPNGKDGSAGGETLNNRLTLIKNILLLVAGIFTVATIITALFLDPTLAKVFSILSYIVIVIITIWYYLSKENRDKWWRDPSILALCVMTAGYFFWVGTWAKVENVDTNDQWCEEYGLKISSPLTDSTVMERVDVGGTFEKAPLESEVLVVHESPGGLGYWPSKLMEIDPTTKTWSGIVHISGDPPVDANILIVKIDKPAGILFDYYFEVSSVDSDWVPIKKFNEIITICDSVSVSREK